MERTIDIIQSSALPLFWALLKMTIPLTLISFALGMVLALITALARISKNRILNGIFFPICLGFPRNAFISQLFIVSFWTSFCRNPNGRMDCSDFDFSLNTGRVCF